MKSRVRRASVALSIPDNERDRAALLRKQTEERLIPNILTALHDRLNAHFGADSVILARRLVIRCAPNAEELSDSLWAEELGRDLAESLIARATRMTAAERRHPDDDAVVVVLENPAHWSALCLARESSRAKPVWFTERRESPVDLWNAACRDGPRALGGLVAYLIRLDALERVLTWLPPAALEEAVERIAIDAWPGEAQSILRDRLQPSAPEIAEGDARSGAQLDKGERERLRASRSSAARDLPASLPRALHGDGAEPAPATPSSNQDLSEASGVATEARAPMSVSPLPQRPHDADRASPAARHLFSRDDRENAGGEPGAAATARAEHARATSPPLERAAPGVRAPPRPIEAAAPPPLSGEPHLDVVTTAYGGLFYLLRLVVQLDLAEHLWCAGIPEGPMLALVGRVLLGKEGDADPAPDIFGGDGALAPVPSWAMDEVRIKTSACLKGWLGSRGLDPTLLPTPEALAAALGRPEGVDPCAAELASLSGAMLTIAFSAALGETPSRAQLLSHLRIPARIEVSEDIRVVMSIEAIDADVRRAGLDFNPGYIPWLRRKVEIVFA